MSVKYLIDPHHGVYFIRFGMPRAEVQKLLGPVRRTVNDRADGGELLDQFSDPDRVQVFYDGDDRVIAVQFPSVAEVVYPPDVSMSDPFTKVLTWAKSQDPKIVSDPRSFRSDALGIAVRKKPSGPAVESVFVYQPGYYK